MRTIGEVLKSARVKKKYSLDKLEELTKIKKDFIFSIEKENWGALPPFPTVLGFVKSVSAGLGIDESSAVAILKRDYPPKKVSVNPSPDISSKFSWSPKLTFIVGTGTILVMILSYLIFQYIAFVSPPALNVTSPKDGETILSRMVNISGKTNSDAKVTANNQPILLDQDGNFASTLEVTPETKEVEVKSISRSGKETTIHRTIIVQ